MAHTIGARFSLRARLFLAMLAIALIAACSFAIAMHQFVEVLEDQLLKRTLRRELDSLAIDYRNGVAIQGERGQSGRVYVARRYAGPNRLPKALRELHGPGYDAVDINGHEYDVAWRDVDGARIYLTLEVAPVERLERRVAVIGWLTLGAAIVIALLIAVVFAYLIVRPVRGLSARLAAFRPGEPATPIANEYADRDIRVIAESFDALTRRFRAVIEREQHFTQDASHELRTPLAVALSSTELLLQQPDLPAGARRHAERIRAAGLRMQRLVAALLFLARGGKSGREICDVADVVRDIVAFYRDRGQAKRLNLTIDCAARTVAAPPGIVDCVVRNLVENAVEHTGGGAIDISLDNRCLVVADSGEGIPQAALDHIFERRYHARQSHGLGIGLYLVYRICQRLEWPLHAGPSVSGGARLEIRFPR